MTFIEFIKPTIIKIILFLVIGYFLIPVFSQPSFCLDLIADNPNDTILPRLPCVKLTTLPQHVYPIPISKNNIVYQQNATYSMDLSMRYGSPILNTLFAYSVSCAIAFSVKSLRDYSKILMRNKKKKEEKLHGS